MRKIILILGVLFLFTSTILAQEYLLGTWGGTRTSLSEFGIDFEFVYTGEYFSVLNSDLKNKSTYLDNIDITATFDFEKLVSWKGAKLFAYVIGNNGGDPNDRVGTFQGITNIATYNTWKLYEFWIEQQFIEEKLSLLLGMYDLNSEFDCQETSGIFINPSHGIGAEYSQSGKNGPSIFSTTSIAARLKYTPTENYYFMLGVFDGVPGDTENPNGTQIVFGENDGLLIACELGMFENGKDFQVGFGKYSIGGWYYTSEFEDLTEVDPSSNPLLLNNNFGLYLSAEKFLISEALNPSQGLAAFFRFGIANSDINPLDYYWGTGINVTGLINGRAEDVLGLAIGTAHAGQKFVDQYKADGISLNKNEIIIEFTYSFQATPWLRIQPDFQYILNPMDSYINSNATVAGLRVELAL
jgi:porin